MSADLLFDHMCRMAGYPEHVITGTSFNGRAVAEARERNAKWVRLYHACDALLQILADMPQYAEVHELAAAHVACTPMVEAKDAHPR